MSKKIGRLFLVLLLTAGLAVIGCSPWGKSSNSANPTNTVTPSTNSQGKNSVGKDGLVVESDNSLPGQSSEQTLNDVDRQLDQLTDTMNQLDEVSQQDTQYGGNE